MALLFYLARNDVRINNRFVRDSVPNNSHFDMLAGGMVHRILVRAEFIPAPNKLQGPATRIFQSWPISSIFQCTARFLFVFFPGSGVGQVSLAHSRN